MLLFRVFLPSVLFIASLARPNDDRHYDANIPGHHTTISSPTTGGNNAHERTPIPQKGSSSSSSSSEEKEPTLKPEGESGNGQPEVPPTVPGTSSKEDEVQETPLKPAQGGPGTMRQSFPGERRDIGPNGESSSSEGSSEELGHVTPVTTAKHGKPQFRQASNVPGNGQGPQPDSDGQGSSRPTDDEEPSAPTSPGKPDPEGNNGQGEQPTGQAQRPEGQTTSPLGPIPPNTFGIGGTGWSTSGSWNQGTMAQVLPWLLPGYWNGQNHQTGSDGGSPHTGFTNWGNGHAAWHASNNGKPGSGGSNQRMWW